MNNTYIIAVSGGVDSVVLLDMLAKRGGPEKYIVVHFDHGIRPNSSEDAKFVKQLATTYKLQLETGQGHLGPNSSEEEARRARYNFLFSVQKKHQAAKVITAHHQDDWLETAIINILRGTGHKGLSAIKANPNVSRPLLDMPKADIIKYAKKNNLQWVEDATNEDQSYLRNYVRKNLLPAFPAGSAQRDKLINILNQSVKDRQKINNIIATLYHNIAKGREIDRGTFIGLPHGVSKEILLLWFKLNDVKQLDKQQIEKAASFSKTAAIGKIYPLDKHNSINIGRDKIMLQVK